MDTRQDKKQQFIGNPKPGRRPLVFAVVAIGVVLFAAGILVFAGGAATGNAFVTARDGQVSVSLADVQDGKAHYYAYRTANGDIVRFFVLKSGDGVVRAAFDACDVCYKALKGYRQEGDVMVCNNCNQQFSSDRINEVKGGCNPAPLTRTLLGDRILLSEQELVAGVRYFPRA